MFDLLWELLHEPHEFATLEAAIETALSFVALVLGIIALACCPEIAPLGVIACLIGVGGLVFGHW